jgi:hypothetical protein
MISYGSANDGAGVLVPECREKRSQSDWKGEMNQMTKNKGHLFRGKAGRKMGYEAQLG